MGVGGGDREGMTMGRGPCCGHLGSIPLGTPEVLFPEDEGVLMPQLHPAQLRPWGRRTPAAEVTAVPGEAPQGGTEQNRGAVSMRGAPLGSGSVSPHSGFWGAEGRGLAESLAQWEAALASLL